MFNDVTHGTNDIGCNTEGWAAIKGRVDGSGHAELLPPEGGGEGVPQVGATASEVRGVPLHRVRVAGATRPHRKVRYGCCFLPRPLRRRRRAPPNRRVFYSRRTMCPGTNDCMMHNRCLRNSVLFCVFYPCCL